MTRLRGLREAAWDLNVPFEGRPLQECAADLGLASRSSYVDAATWDRHFWWLAIQRVAELRWLPDASQRPDGSAPSTLRIDQGPTPDTQHFTTLEGPEESHRIIRAFEQAWAPKGAHSSGDSVSAMLDPKTEAVAAASSHDIAFLTTSYARISNGGRNYIRKSELAFQFLIRSQDILKFKVETPPAGYVLINGDGIPIRGVHPRAVLRLAVTRADLQIFHSPGAYPSSLSAKTAGVSPVEISFGGFKISGEVEARRFRDVPWSMQFSEDIEWLAKKKITTGWPDHTFRPLDTVSREATAAFLYRVVGLRWNAPTPSIFKDVKPNHQFYNEIYWLGDSEISTGWPDGAFRPGLPVGRDAMAAFFYRLGEAHRYFTPPKKPSFRDVPVSNQFFTEIEWMRSVGISTGWPDGTYRPLEPIRRDAMAAFLHRFHDWFRTPKSW